MSGRVQDLEPQGAAAELVAFLQELVNLNNARRRDTQPLRLHAYILIQGQIGLVHQYGGAGGELEFFDAAHVIDVRVRRHNVFDTEVVSRQNFLNAINFISRIDDHCVAGVFIPQD